MAKSLRITSRANARVQKVLRLRRVRDRSQAGLFIAEGEREVRRAVQAGLVMKQLFVCPQILERRGAEVGGEVWLVARGEVESFEANEGVFLKLAYRADPEGVLAVFEQRRWALDEAAAAAAGTKDLWLVFAGATKPGNLGAMARTATAAGATGLLLADSVVDAYNPNAIRASTGAVFSLPIVGASGQAILNFLKSRGVNVLAADPYGKNTYTDVDLTGAVAVVIGAEDSGLGALFRAGANQLVKVPMVRGVVDSLNASVVAGALLFETVRQRTRIP